MTSFFAELYPSSCSTPSSGLSIKLSYVPRSGQSFYNNILQLPYTTNKCPVDIFINLDNNKDMKGLSFYSKCLELKFESLLFWELEHKFFIPMTDDTLCIKAEKFTSLFPDTSQFGLLVHSYLLKDNLRLGSFFTLQQGYSDNITVSLGFSHSTSDRVGLLHSVKINVLDGSFITSIILRNNELIFSGSTTIFSNYFVHMTGVASTVMSWEDLTISINGWFPRVPGNLVDELEKSVHDKIKRTAAFYNLTLQYNLSEIYTIVNITFSVDVKKVSPAIIPINIIANISYNQARSTFMTPFHFKQSLLAQKNAIVDGIVSTTNPSELEVCFNISGSYLCHCVTGYARSTNGTCEGE